MRSGGLRNRIIIQQKTVIRDSYGGEGITWATFYECAAKIDPTRGREFFAAGQKQADITVPISIRYKSGILPNMRISWNGRTFDINAITNVEERNRELILFCTEHIQ